MHPMSRDSLLPRSLFSASTLKLEPTEDTLDSTLNRCLVCCLGGG